MITSKIIADSLNAETGDRITSWVLEYPRFIHSEILTHRMFSKNSASSRALPIEKTIKMVQDNPAMPEFWGKNQSGMQAYEELNPDEIEKAKKLWLEARDKAVESVKLLCDLNCHKQIANRILEPWVHMRIILTATEYENFFALRAHPAAQPEFQKLAFLMLEQYNNSTPKKMELGEWHIPFGDNFDEKRLDSLVNDEAFKMSENGIIGDLNVYARNELKKKISIARCARVSYFNFEGKDDYDADIKLCDRLFGSVPRHLSPTEHIAQAVGKTGFIGNFKGWKQYRYFFNDQNLKDSRVKKPLLPNDY